MRGLLRHHAEYALRAGWERSKLLEVQAFAQARNWSVSSQRHDAVFFEGRFIAYRDRPTEDLEFAVKLDELPHTVIAYTDGSGTLDDALAGIGVVIEAPGFDRILIGENIGYGTNNRAELMAIYRALQAVPNALVQFTIRSDSQYAIGVIKNRSWKLNKNVELVQSIRTDIDDRRLGISSFVDFEHVRGHQGILGNELADRLANSGRLGEPPKLNDRLREYIGAQVSAL